MLKSLRALSRLFLFILTILSLLGQAVFLTGLYRSAESQRKIRIARMMQRHLKAMSWIAGLKVHVHGPRPRADRPFLLLCNHVSYWDILALGGLFPMGFMAKDCIARWPLLGTVIRFCNTIFVDRDNIQGRCRSLRKLQNQIQDLSYCVFPEGTTTAAVAPLHSNWRRGNIAVLKKPAAEVWLAALHYKSHEVQAWIDDDALLPHLFSRMREPSIELNIHLQPLKVEEGIPLSQAAASAWLQTARLCEKAQRESLGTDLSRPIQLRTRNDTAVS